MKKANFYFILSLTLFLIGGVLASWAMYHFRGSQETWLIAGSSWFLMTSGFIGFKAYRELDKPYIEQLENANELYVETLEEITTRLRGRLDNREPLTTEVIDEIEEQIKTPVMRDATKKRYLKIDAQYQAWLELHSEQTNYRATFCKEYDVRSATLTAAQKYARDHENDPKA